MAPPPGSLVVDLDELGPESAKSHPGVRLVRSAEHGPHGPRAGRARQEIDYGRRGKGYLFGALVPTTGAVLTAPYRGRTTTNWVDFLDRVDAWLPPEVERIYAIQDNLSAHRAMDVLLWSLLHPRWEFVFQPTYAAYLNLLESWWKILRSLAFKGRRFNNWGRDRAGRRRGDRLLERPHTSLPLGPAPSPSRGSSAPRAPVRYRYPAQGRLNATCGTDH
jgi:hypothetical protein